MNGRKTGAAKRRLSHQDLVRILGDIADDKAAAIIATGARAGDVEKAVAWAAGETDVMGEERQPLTGLAAEVYDIMTSDEDLVGEDER